MTPWPAALHLPPDALDGQIERLGLAVHGPSCDAPPPSASVRPLQPSQHRPAAPASAARRSSPTRVSSAPCPRLPLGGPRHARGCSELPWSFPGNTRRCRQEAGLATWCVYDAIASSKPMRGTSCAGRGARSTPRRFASSTICITHCARLSFAHCARPTVADLRRASKSAVPSQRTSLWRDDPTRSVRRRGQWRTTSAAARSGSRRSCSTRGRRSTAPHSRCVTIRSASCCAASTRSRPCRRRGAPRPVSPNSTGVARRTR